MTGSFSDDGCGQGVVGASHVSLQKLRNPSGMFPHNHPKRFQREKEKMFKQHHFSGPDALVVATSYGVSRQTG